MQGLGARAWDRRTYALAGRIRAGVKHAAASPWAPSLVGAQRTNGRPAHL